MKKLTAICVAVVLLLSLMPTASASGETRTFITLDEESSAIAPGVTQEIKYVRKDNGSQMVYYTLTADLGREEQDVHIYANYKNNEWTGTPGLQETSKQMAAAQKKHSDPEDRENYIENYTVVGGVNGDFYNMNTGKPTSTFVMGGQVINNNDSNRNYFAILKDGTPVIGFSKADWDAYMKSDNPIVEAIGGSNHTLIRDGRNVASDWGGSKSDPNARTAIGVTADKKVVMLVVDGKQAPFSEGCDMTELASILLAMGCQNAINLDGGGSTTFLARPEGESNVKVVNRPCDGFERAVASSLMVVSTFTPSDEFARAAISEDHEYITPGGTVALNAVGISPAGTPAEIPDDVTWDIQGGGEIHSDASGAVFTAGDQTGDVKIRMLRGGEEVGSTIIHVVIPNGFHFVRPSYAVPYGKSIQLEVKATYTVGAGEFEVALHEGDVTYSLLDPSAGTLDGGCFKACDNSEKAPAGTTVRAELKCASLTDEASLTLGKDSEILFDFETEDQLALLSTYPKTNANYFMDIEIVDKEHGMVHDGDHALKVTADFSNITWGASGSGFFQIFLKYSGYKDLAGAQRIGAWVWIPDEDNVSAISIRADVDGVNTYNLANMKEGVNYDEGRWLYVSMDLSEMSGKSMKVYPDMMSVLLCAQNASGAPVMSANNKLVYYIDTYTIDYSSAVPDREMPVIGSVRTARSGDEYGVLERGEIYRLDTRDTVRFQAAVSDEDSGVSQVKAYIDGVEIGAQYASGQIVTEDVKLAAGIHTLKLYASDGAGNTVNATRQFEVQANSDVATVRVRPKDPAADRIPITSLYYIDVEATDVSKIQSVSMDLDLNNISIWELDHAEVDSKFSLAWEFRDDVARDENIATLTLTRRADWAQGDSSVIASLPIRTWGTDYPTSVVFLDKGTIDWSPEYAWRNQYFFPVDITVDVDRGEIVYAVDYTTDTLPVFGGERIQVDTELYDFSEKVTAAPENKDKTSWHTHDGELKTLSREATCTEAGYTGRTYCETCRSVVDWGTDIEPAGHAYETVEGVLQCRDCGDRYSGVYEPDGRTYRDGVVCEGWQEDDTYYVDGVKNVGVRLVDGLYFDFGEDGACAGRTPITGFFRYEGTTRYALAGKLEKGWFSIGERRYHAGEDGAVHNVSEDGTAIAAAVRDTRTCLTSGYLVYTCGECGEEDRSELLWYEGHKWNDPNTGDYTCTVCGAKGIDIADAKVTFAGKYFTYTGGGILAKHTLTYGGRTLLVESDRDGRDGLSTYTNNVDVGLATLTVEGRGDFYGTVTAQFEIVPASVETLNKTEEGEHTIKLTWEPAPGAEYYSVWYRDNGEGEWLELAHRVEDTSYTVAGLTLGEHYAYRVASRTDVDGRTFYCTNWSNTVAGVIAHTWGEPEEGSHAASCTEDGRLIHTCAICGEREDIVTPALGHTVKTWETTVPPTTSAEGKREGVCTVCGETVEKSIEKLPPEQTGAGGSTAPGNRQETVVNPDGSTTTTTTAPDGAVTETTTRTDGSVTEKVTRPDGSAVQHTATPDGVAGRTETDTGGRITSAEVVIPAAAAESGTVTAPVEIPPAKHSGDAPQISVQVEGNIAARVEIPVTECDPGTVAVVVHPDGTEEVVRDCAFGDNGIVLNVEGGVTLKIIKNSRIFADVQKAGHWASDAVEFVTARELFNGTGGAFSPDKTMSRGMLVTVLYRLAYEPEAGAVKFGDVSGSAYYADAVAWAAGNGVVKGYSPSLFGPEDEVTREQLVTILYRYAETNGCSVAAKGDLGGFTDADEISGYAAAAMEWAVGAGLIRGVGGNRINPAGSATRAEAAAILMRFCQNVVR